MDQNKTITNRLIDKSLNETEPKSSNQKIHITVNSSTGHLNPSDILHNQKPINRNQTSKFEPDSEKLRVTFSDLSKKNSSIVLKFCLSLAPILYAIYRILELDTTITNCYTKDFKPLPLINCIQCNDHETHIAPNRISRRGLYVSAVLSLIIYLFGLFIAISMIKEAYLSLKFIPYKVKLARNRWSSLAYIFFGITFFNAFFSLSFYDASLLVYPCGSIMMSLVEYPIPAIWYLKRFIVQLSLMGGFYAIFITLLKDPASMIINFNDLIQKGTIFAQEKQPFLDFSKMKYSVSHSDFKKTIKTLKLSKEKDEKKKFISVLTKMDENGQVFDYKFVEKKSYLSKTLQSLGFSHEEELDMIIEKGEQIPDLSRTIWGFIYFFNLGNNIGMALEVFVYQLQSMTMELIKENFFSLIMTAIFFISFTWTARVEVFRNAVQFRKTMFVYIIIAVIISLALWKTATGEQDETTALVLTILSLILFIEVIAIISGLKMRYIYRDYNCWRPN